MGLAGAGLAASSLTPFASALTAPITGFPAGRNDAYRLDRPITVEEEATTYTNFYEFGSSKNIWRRAQKLVTDPWMVTIDGMVDEDMQLDAADLIAKLGPQEERLYRHRCVEAWAMAVPWTGADGAAHHVGPAQARGEICPAGNLYGPGYRARPASGLVPLALC